MPKPKPTYPLQSTKAFLDLGEAVVKAAAELKALGKAAKTKGRKPPTVVIPLCTSPDAPVFCVKPPPPPGPWGIEITLVKMPKAGKGGLDPRIRTPEE